MRFSQTSAKSGDSDIDNLAEEYYSKYEILLECDGVK
jgi:hypothetical protein